MTLPPYPPPAPPPSGRGVFRRHPLLVGAVVLGAFAVLLAALIVVGFTRGGHSDGFSFRGKVAVVKLEGVILDSDTVMREIKEHREDDTVKAVVLRVDSPGGAVGPSQEIHREVVRLAAAKTVVASFGGVAASGGYYAACPATKIMANPGTITGSIGVVMEITNLEKLFEWAKISHNVIKSGKFKDVGSPYRAMTDEERAYLQTFIDDVHGQFEQAVAEGRHLPPERVHELADGRIFSGRQAIELGLVDQLGNLEDAITLAAELAGIEGEPEVIWPAPPRRFWFLDMLGSLAQNFARQTDASTVRALYLMPGY